MSVEKLDNQSEYALTQRRRELFNQMGGFSAGVGSVYQPQANNRYGKKIAAQGQGNPVQNNPFGGLISVSKNKANPVDQKGNLDLERLSNGVDINKLSAEQLKRLDAIRTQGVEGNDGNDRVDVLSANVLPIETHLVGDQADSEMAKKVALTRGIQVTSVQTQVQARLLPPQLQEMIRGLMLPNLPHLTQANTQAADDGFQKWTVELKQFFEPMGSATQQQGDSQQGFDSNQSNQQPSQQGFRFKG
jgi:hypothetical protein